MKKSIVILLLFILTISLVFAAEGVSPTDELKKNLGNVDTSAINTNMTNALHKEVAVSPGMQTFAKLLFGIKEPSITFEKLIILLAVWIGFAVIIYSILSVIPLFGNKSFINILISIIVTALASMQGAVQQSSIFITSLFAFLDFTRFSFLKVIIIVIVLLLVIIVISVISKMIKNQSELEDAGNTGMNVGVESAIAKKTRKMS
jgi:signal transduction histidine kinase